MSSKVRKFKPKSRASRRDVTIVKRVVYGNTAKAFPNKREVDGHTHQWTVFLKPYLDEDMSTYVREVHFKLHESFPNPKRIITKPPYEVTETGWGEFYVVIEIFFKDPQVKEIVTLTFALKLSETGSEVQEKRTAIVTEYYEEMIFKNPPARMYNLLTTTQPLSQGPPKHMTDFEEKEQKTLETIQNAKKEIRRRISEIQGRMRHVTEATAKLQLK